MEKTAEGAEGSQGLGWGVWLYRRTFVSSLVLVLVSSGLGAELRLLANALAVLQCLSLVLVLLNAPAGARVMRSGVGVFVLGALAYGFLERAKNAVPVTNELFFAGLCVVGATALLHRVWIRLAQYLGANDAAALVRKSLWWTLALQLLIMLGAGPIGIVLSMVATLVLGGLATMWMWMALGEIQRRVDAAVSPA